MTSRGLARAEGAVMLPLVIAVALVIIAIVLLPQAIASARCRFALRACVLHYVTRTPPPFSTPFAR